MARVGVKVRSEWTVDRFLGSRPDGGRDLQADHGAPLGRRADGGPVGGASA